ILSACADWATMRQMEDALRLPQDHRAHSQLRTRLHSFVVQGRAETRRLDGHDREWRAVEGYRPRQMPRTDERRIIDYVEDGDSTGEVARKMGLGLKAAYGRLHRLEAKGELVAERRGQFVQDRWFKPITKTPSEESETMVYRGDVYDVLTEKWQSTAAIADQVERTTNRRSAHERQVWQCLDRLAEDGQAERSRSQGHCIWRRI
ncbi:MAG: hypothetical protein IKP10_00455, partial [Clostridia bacterium]|nr:hypothetical protein [Clostridia bacterium]